MCGLKRILNVTTWVTKKPMYWEMFIQGIKKITSSIYRTCSFNFENAGVLCRCHSRQMPYLAWFHTAKQQVTWDVKKLYGCAKYGLQRRQSVPINISGSCSRMVSYDMAASSKYVLDNSFPPLTWSPCLYLLNDSVNHPRPWKRLYPWSSHARSLCKVTVQGNRKVLESESK